MQACGHTPIWNGPRTLRTNARGRHTYLPEFKQWIIEQAQQPGTSLAGLAMSNQVNANQLRRWVQLHGMRSEPPAAAARLLPVTISAEPALPLPPSSPPLPSSSPPVMSAPAVACVEIEFGGAVLRVRDGIDPATLRTVLHCLRGTAP